MERTCTTPGCGKKHVAKGLCSTCYNRANYTPGQRHAKVEVPCGWCGKPTLKEPGRQRRYQAVFCGLECRDAWRAAQPSRRSPVRNCSTCGSAWEPGLDQLSRCPRCREAAATTRLARAAEARDAQALRAEMIRQQMEPRPCADCGTVYAPGTMVQRHCSKRCARRVARRARKAREHQAVGSFTWTQVVRLLLVFGRRCAYCEQPLAVADLQPDHVIPLSKQGHNGIGNILPSCASCNGDKRDLLLADWNPDRVRRGLTRRVTAWTASDARYRHLTAQAAQSTGT